jgi:hypothetical protein
MVWKSFGVRIALGSPVVIRHSRFRYACGFSSLFPRLVTAGAKTDRATRRVNWPLGAERDIYVETKNSIIKE